MRPSHLYVHRSRFVDYSPPSITALAFSHPHLSKSSLIPASLRLAIGRSNGDIEIWNPRGNWFHESTLKGGKGRSIEGLAWIQDTQSDGSQLRLFSVGYSSVVTEWDLERGGPKTHVDCNGSVIWSLAAQPRVLCAKGPGGEELGQDLVVGLDDGSVTLLATEGGPGSLEYRKTLAKSTSSKARILSLAWQNRYTVVAGMADSTIRVWDIRSGRILTRMALGKSPAKKGRSREALVWAVRVLPNGDIISGDSRGEVLFWDGKTYSLRQRIKAHEGDVLTMDVNRAGDMVVASGVDRRTVLFGLQMGGPQKGRWAEVVGKRLHSHDVRAVAVWEGGPISTMVSGGIDMTPVVAPFAKFMTAHHRVLQAIPQKPIVTCLPQARLLMSWYDHEVKVWSIDKLDHITSTLKLSGSDSTGRKLVSRLILGNEENITNAHIIPISTANAGYILAVSTIAEVKIFHLRPPRRKTVSYALRVSKVEIPTNFVVDRGLPEDQDSTDDSGSAKEEQEAVSITRYGARLVHFSPDGRWLLVITPESKVVLIPIKTEIITRNKRPKASVSLSSKVFVLDRILKTTSYDDTHNATPKKGKEGAIDFGGLGIYPHTISQVAFSHNSRILVVSDLSGHLDTYILQGGIWIFNPAASLLPKLEHPIVAMEFRPSSSRHLSVQQLARLPPASTSENSDFDSGDENSDDESHQHEMMEFQEDRLMVLTTHKQDVFEFHILKGKLTAWSRRNPPSCFTPDFKNVVDLACGIVWEVEESEGKDQGVFTKERIWFWGPNWIWMFDLQQDFSNPDTATLATTEYTPHERSNKRKRGPNVTGKIKESMNTTPSSAPERVDRDGDIAMLDDPNVKSSDDDDDDFRQRDEGDENNVPDSRWSTFSRTKSTDGAPVARHSASKSKPCWCSYKYRPIMALFPIGEWGLPPKNKGSEETVGNPEIFKEMVVVERPAWDIELPPAFFGRREKTDELRKSIWN